jgi:hypothetical protein
VIKLRVHPGSAAYPAGFVERHIFEFDGGGSLGHEGLLLCHWCIREEEC